MFINPMGKICRGNQITSASTGIQDGNQALKGRIFGALSGLVDFAWVQSYAPFEGSVKNTGLTAITLDMAIEAAAHDIVPK